ncbi:HK97 gp10 family phage protein [Propionibacteriaceae bacterium G57]|uniref:HK97 gp10 family phage protein n=1 Tax=Aestuariimicrobium sp. G57 TaxID=3418485 RepID=UPI003DA6D15F
MTVRVEGLRATVRNLEKFGAEVGDLKDVMSRAGDIVVGEAKRLVTVRSGRLQGSIRTGKGKNKATVRAGSARVPYAGANNYGRGSFRGSLWLERAGSARRAQVAEVVNDGLADIAKRLDLI